MMLQEAIQIASSLVMQFEGFRSKPYRCPAGVWTIGLGTTVYPDGRKVKQTDKPLTEEEAVVFMRYEVEKSLSQAVKYCPVLVKSDWRAAAITDFVYNLGPGRLQTSTLRRRVNAEDWPEAAYEIRRWVYAAGRKLPGLVLRRETEAKLLL